MDVIHYAEKKAKVSEKIYKELNLLGTYIYI